MPPVPPRTTYYHSIAHTTAAGCEMPAVLTPRGIHPPRPPNKLPTTLTGQTDRTVPRVVQGRAEEKPDDEAPGPPEWISARL